MKVKKDISVWRFNVHTHRSWEQPETFEYCKENGIIGTGWGPKKGQQQERLMSTKTEKIDDAEFYKRIEKSQKKFEYANPQGFKNSMKALREMEKDDLIWTRKINKYYLCRVTGPAQDFIRGERSNEIEDSFFDIWHYIPCEYIEIGTEEDVLGAIVRSFNRGVISHIRAKGNEELVKNFSKKTYNDFSGKEYYEYKKPIDKWQYFFDSMGALEIEEIVGLYMQIKLGYSIYTSTNKTDTKEYEYILFERTNPRKSVKLQVKATDIDLNKYNFGDKPFYFFTISNYWKDGKILDLEELEKFGKENNAVFLRKEELLQFAKDNENTGLLPYKLNWF